MTLLIGALLIFVGLISSCLFWQVIKATARINRTLSDSIASDDLVSGLAGTGFFEKTAADASDVTGTASCSTGHMWSALLASGAEYPEIINMEARSSARAFRAARNALLAVVLAVFGIEFFLPKSYIVISGAVFFLMALVPLSEPGAKRAFSELCALSWLIFRFYKSNPGECSKSLAKLVRLKHLYEAVAALDPEHRPSDESLHDSQPISPAGFRRAYLSGSVEIRKQFGLPDARHGAEMDELVRLLVNAGIGVGVHKSRRITGPRPPVFWRKSATAANQLRTLLRQNPSASADAREELARRIVDHNHLVHLSLR
jgi:hypothetical protein